MVMLGLNICDVYAVRPLGKSFKIGRNNKTQQKIHWGSIHLIHKGFRLKNWGQTPAGQFIIWEEPDGGVREFFTSYTGDIQRCYNYAAWLKGMAQQEPWHQFREQKSRKKNHND